MKLRLHSRAVALVGLVLVFAVLTYAQGTAADYERAQNLRKRFEGAVTNFAGRATWIERTNRFWYRRSNRGETEFIQFDVDTMTRTRLFDHERLAASLSAVSGETYKPLDLPFSTFTFVNNGGSIQFNIADNLWRCDLSDGRVHFKVRAVGILIPGVHHPTVLWRHTSKTLICLFGPGTKKKITRLASTAQKITITT